MPCAFRGVSQDAGGGELPHFNQNCVSSQRKQVFLNQVGRVYYSSIILQGDF